MRGNPKGATCVVEQLWPGITVDRVSAQLASIIDAASRLPQSARPRVLGATLIPEDETVFTWCVAPSIDSVRSLLQASGVGFDRVLQVVDVAAVRSDRDRSPHGELKRRAVLKQKERGM